MQELLQLFRFDRQTNFYDSGPMVRRYARAAAGRKRRAAQAAAKKKADATLAAAAANKAAAAAEERRTRPTRNVSIQSRIGRYTPGKNWSSSYHTSSAKKSRRSSRSSRAKSIRKSTGRYSQLM